MTYDSGEGPVRDEDRLRRLVWLGFVLLLFAAHAMVVLAAPTPGERRPPAYQIDAVALREIFDELRGD